MSANLVVSAVEGAVYDRALFLELTKYARS
jgi:hypothetical protein